MKKKLAGRKVGFIGLGVMGSRMARHLHEAGTELFVHNRTRSVAEAFAETRPGTVVLDTAAEIAGACAGEVIFLMLTNTPAVEAVVRGEDGLTSADLDGALIIDSSTTGLRVTRECADAVGNAGGSWVDAPVSGGQIGAENGVLTMMAGGSETDFERALPYLEVVGEKITRLGDTGAGQIAKLANQVIVAMGITALAEAFTLAREAGVEPGLVRDAIRGGFAESRLLAEHGERMVTGNFEPGGRSVLQLKDVREARDLMDELGLDLPMLRRNFDLWVEMVEEKGLGELDHSGIYRLYEKT